MGRFDQARANIRRAYEARRASVRATHPPEGETTPGVNDAAVSGSDALDRDALDRDAVDSGGGLDRDGLSRDGLSRDGLSRAGLSGDELGGPRLGGDGLSRGGLSGPGLDPSVHVTHTSVTSRDDAEIPRGLRLAAAWSWRLLLIAAAIGAVLWALVQLHQVVVPVAIALLLSALLSPAVGWLRRRGIHRTLSTVLVLIAGVALVAGTLTLVVTEFVSKYADLSSSAQSGLTKIQNWLKTGIFHLTDKQLDGLLNTLQAWLKDHQSSLTTGALSTATTALDVVASTFLILFTTFFFLRDGDRIWRFLVDLLPRGARMPIANAGFQSWSTLVAYVRATVLVAFIDAVGIGIGLFILRVDLAFALAALVFLGAFIPIVGATLSGTVAILVALVTRNPVTALLVLALVIGVQQLEGHVLQPLIMGRAVSIHPLAVILAIASGLVLAGIIGALVAVPIVAVVNTGIRHLVAHRRHLADPPPPTAVVVRD